MSQAQATTQISITLKDGSVRNFPLNVTGLDIATSISPKLAKEAVAILFNNEEWDLNRPIDTNGTLEIILRQDPAGLEILRHDAAHIMAQAVKQLFPETQVTIGPAIENGFYYDFYREKSFTPDDLAHIEKRMHQIVDQNIPIVRHVWSREQAVKFFQNLGEKFKVELIESIPQEQGLTFYEQGEFIDLCRGPHLPSTGRLGKGFKLMKLAGAYWRGDHRNPMLQRIYGTAWASEKDLQAYLYQLEEAEKRDHRKLGAELDLFHFQQEAAGSVFWHPKGWTLYRTIEQFMRKRLEKCDYVEVKTPQILDRDLWEKSGHWEKFRQNMFTVDCEDRTLAIKPMNCPGHVQIFKQGIKSYRDLPLRMAEFGSCHRNEPSGALHGLMRVRAFVQDDAHIFCTPDQIISETKLFCDLLKNVYTSFGFEKIFVKFSDRPEVRAGSDDVWDQAEQSLIKAAQEAGLDYILNPGEGAFYGPKLEFVLRDALGRDWQCGTLQVDFVLPERLDANYIDVDGQKKRPVMLHRAILGSFERFIGVILEHFGGKFPLWLSPVQITIATITSDADSYAQQIYEKMRTAGLRIELDTRNEKISYKIRELSLQKIPVIFVVGAREAQNNQVAIRRLGSQDQEIMDLTDAIQLLIAQAQEPKFDF